MRNDFHKKWYRIVLPSFSESLNTAGRFLRIVGEPPLRFEAALPLRDLEPDFERDRERERDFERDVREPERLLLLAEPLRLLDLDTLREPLRDLERDVREPERLLLPLRRDAALPLLDRERERDRDFDRDFEREAREPIENDKKKKNLELKKLS